MAHIFVSYRRADSIYITGRIREYLESRFGEESVFMDVDSIPLGIDFRAHVRSWLAQCDVVLVVIGPDWLQSAYQRGPRRGQLRLADPADFVRIEVAEAIAARKPVIPVLVGGAAMPRVDELPPALADLAIHNATQVRPDPDFRGDLQRLIHGIQRLVQAPARSAPRTAATVASRVEPPAVERPSNLSFEQHHDGQPIGWFNSVGHVDGVSPIYKIGVVPREEGGRGRCVLLAHASPQRGEFGSLMQRCPAAAFAGQHVILQAEIRSENVLTQAGMWLRADLAAGPPLLDNMHDRPIRGTTPWRTYRIEAKLPDNTQWLNYGFLLAGPGSLYCDNVRLRIQAGNRWIRFP